MQDEMKEQLDKRDTVLRYLKQVDYNLKPSKEIYTRVKTKIIGLSGINAKPDKSYAELCKQAGLDLEEGKALINSLYNKELIHMIKKYDASILGSDVEAYYIDKSYTETPVPDIGLFTVEEAHKYISDLLKMGVYLRSLSNIDYKYIVEVIDTSSDLTNNEKYYLKGISNRNSLFNAMTKMSKLISVKLEKEVDFALDVIKFVNKKLEGTGVDLVQNLLSDACHKIPNVPDKFFCGSCDMGDANTRYYLFPF